LAPQLLNASNKGRGVRVRITDRPRERDIEGVSLDRMLPGTVCDVSSSVGTWLIVQGYGYPEMRRATEEDEVTSDIRGAQSDRTGIAERRRRYLR
jgi:hypothetical protein